jgi:hypothetical protein
VGGIANAAQREEIVILIYKSIRRGIKEKIKATKTTESKMSLLEFNVCINLKRQLWNNSKLNKAGLKKLERLCWLK